MRVGVGTTVIEYIETGEIIQGIMEVGDGP